jgi:SsrA-binding protein
MSLAENKKALFDYEILEKLEAGLVLTGYEAKSAKAGNINLKGSFVTFHNNDALLTNTHIGLYKPAGKMDEYDPTHSRRLLLKRREIDYLRSKSEEKGLTIVPLRVYTKQRFIKVEIGIARGKKTYDKRETIKKRDMAKEVKRTLKNLR